MPAGIPHFGIVWNINDSCACEYTIVLLFQLRETAILSSELFCNFVDQFPILLFLFFNTALRSSLHLFTFV